MVVVLRRVSMCLAKWDASLPERKPTEYQGELLQRRILRVFPDLAGE
jgi:hypothetical protein